MGNEPVIKLVGALLHAAGLDICEWRIRVSFEFDWLVFFLHRDCRSLLFHRQFAELHARVRDVTLGGI